MEGEIVSDLSSWARRRDREVYLQANRRFLDALAGVDNPTDAKRALERVTKPKQHEAGRPLAGFNPLARYDGELFQSVMDGKHCLKGFTNCEFPHSINQRIICVRAGETPESKVQESAISLAATTPMAPSAT